MATITGTDNSDFLEGTDAADLIKGFGGVDNLTGGFGADTLNGGAGSDRANYDDSDAAVTVILGGSLNGSGAGGTAAGDVLASIESVTGSIFNDTIIGDEFDNNLDGGGGVDTLKGAGGNDFLRGSGSLDGGEGNDTLRGGALADDMVGGIGDDTLDGREGADTMNGGAGIDTAVYEASDVGVTVILGNNGSGTGGDAQGDVLIGIENVKGSFGEENQLIGDANRNVLSGGQANDLLKGAGGSDELVGEIGNDTLEGGEGNDLLIGGFNADRLDGGAGVDTVDYFDSNAGISITVNGPAGVGGDANGDILVGIENVDGTDFADVIRGDGAANELFGGDGADTLKGGGGADDLFGSFQNDVLHGDAGDDTLDGGSGADIMRGAEGNDTYFVSEIGDRVEETIPDAGIDTVNSNVTFSLSSANVQGAVENLTLGGGASINGVGNALANTLIGNSGANNLNGNSGADRMAGRGGNDDYVVNEVGDVVDESLAGSSGIDDVLAFVSFDLSGPKAKGSVENLRLALGTANLNAHGNALGNELVGNNGVNVLTGAAGNDKLTGFGGNDFFVFATALNALTNVDTIEDYNVAQDTMRLENAFFTGLANGVLAAGAFRIGAAAADASDRVIYNDDTGAMFFDRDGTGAAAAVRFATLDEGLAMTNADFFVI